MPSTENQKLKEVRKALGLKQEEFAIELELTQGGYSDIERGKNGVSTRVKQILVEKFHVNLEWFEGDDGGEMFFIEPSDDEEVPFSLAEQLEINNQNPLISILSAEVRRLNAEKRLYRQLIATKDKTIYILERQVAELKK